VVPVHLYNAAAWQCSVAMRLACLARCRLVHVGMTFFICEFVNFHVYYMLFVSHNKATHSQQHGSAAWLKSFNHGQQPGCAVNTQLSPDAAPGVSLARHSSPPFSQQQPGCAENPAVARRCCCPRVALAGSRRSLPAVSLQSTESHDFKRNASSPASEPSTLEYISMTTTVLPNTLADRRTYFSIHIATVHI
jgi:hypothetical protein